MKSIRAEDLIVIRLDEGEEVISSLKAVAKDERIHSAVILSFVGALKYSKVIVRKGVEKEISLHVEAVGNGNMTALNGEPFVHLHVALGNDDGSWVGHLLKGIVDIFCEVALQPMPFEVCRAYDSDLAEKGVTVPFRLELG
ncbi:MAG: PPC domain-containing DNA-binding protein [Candidatus Methanosuratincola sp.]|nr:DNA-binding protein [Candidatus Methanosuratincola sp.]